jgi:hypothetical protein
MALLVGAAALGLTLPVATAARAASGRTPAGTPVPTGFVGVNADGPLVTAADHVDLSSQLGLMVRNGVESIRVPFSWAQAQPYEVNSDVPPARADDFVDVRGVPTDFSATDQVVALAAERGLRVLPVVLYAPGWDARANSEGFATPANPAPYARYLTALVDRYGPHGTFWNDHGPRRPIRMWQIWNEPNLSSYWPAPSTVGYLRLLRAAHAAIKRADPGAETVIGAITNISWQYLAQIYRRHGRGLFDVIAVNPFTATPAGIVQILRLVRQTATRFGDRLKPLIATEVGWTSAQSACECTVFDWDSTTSGQARRVAATLPVLAAHRKSLRLAGFYYYTWIGDQSKLNYDFDFAGLVGWYPDRAIALKPALGAFARAALALEGCARHRGCHRTQATVSLQSGETDGRLRRGRAHATRSVSSVRHL